MKTGKLPTKILEKLLENIPKNNNVIQGPKIGMDGAKIKSTENNIIIGSDPITFSTNAIGKYSVYINANDIAVSGAIPKYFMSTILLPPIATEENACNIFNQVSDTCKELNIALVGGHTEITDSVTRPIISGTMIGEEIYNMIPTNAQAGNHIILVNKPCIEGTSILAYNGREKLIHEGISEEIIENSINLINNPGICVLPIVMEIFNSVKNNTIYYMHDPTEGGIGSALEELAKAIGKEIIIDEIEFMDETIKFCKIFNLNPMGLISSGSLLAVVDSGYNIVEDLNTKGYYAKIIGEVTANPTRDKSNVKYKNMQIQNFDRDEIAVFFNNCKK